MLKFAGPQSRAGKRRVGILGPVVAEKDLEQAAVYLSQQYRSAAYAHAVFTTAHPISGVARRKQELGGRQGLGARGASIARGCRRGHRQYREKREHTGAWYWWTTR